MNQALDQFEFDSRVMNISGYTPPVSIPKSYNMDIIALSRMNAWGLGLWGDKFENVDLNLDYSNISNEFKSLSAYLKLCKGGIDIPSMVISDSQKKIDALDVKMMYHQCKHDLITIFPRRTLVQNVGHDGSGEHGVSTNAYVQKLWMKKGGFNLDKGVELNPIISKSHYIFRSRKAIGRVYSLMFIRQIVLLYRWMKLRYLIPSRK
jgi:hypothetical protein